jgi:hypothetical protein
MRRRLGKVTHIEVNRLWLQDTVGSDHCARCEPAERRAQRKRCEGWRGSKNAYTPGSLGTSSRKGESVLPGSGEGSGTDKQCGDHSLQSGDATTIAAPSSGDSPKNRGEPIRNEIQGEREETRTIPTEML